MLQYSSLPQKSLISTLAGVSNSEKQFTRALIVPNLAVSLTFQNRGLEITEDFFLSFLRAIQS